MENLELQAADGKNDAKRFSPWEWLPIAGLPAFGATYLLTPPGTPFNRFAFLICLGLLPGTLWRLSGRGSWNVHRICFAASLVVFVLDNPGLRPDVRIWGKMADNWGIVASGFIISFTQPLWGMARTRLLLNDSGVRITYRDSLKLCMIGSFFNMFLPGSTGGDAYRIYAITRGYRAKLSTAIASITLDRILGLPSLILVVVMGVALDYQFFLDNSVLRKLVPFIVGIGLVCLTMVVYLTLAGKHSRRNATSAGRERGAGNKPGWLRRLHIVISMNVASPATLPLALFHGFASHLASIASCQLFGLALGVQGVPAIRYYLIVPMAMTINAIPGAPGGVGQGELAMATLLDMASPGLGNAQEGVAIMLLFRLSNILLGLAGGLWYALDAAEVSNGVAKVMRHGAATMPGDVDAATQKGEDGPDSGARPVSAPVQLDGRPY